METVVLFSGSSPSIWTTSLPGTFLSTSWWPTEFTCKDMGDTHASHMYTTCMHMDTHVHEHADVHHYTHHAFAQSMGKINTKYTHT